MEYLLPKEISERLWISLKTVYNYLTKYKGQILTKRSEWKTFVNFESFQNILQNTLQTDTKPLITNSWDTNDKQDFENIVTLQNQLQNLQTDFERVNDEKTNLEKYNTNLTDQVNKFALALSNEKKEKEDIMKRADEIQEKYTATIESFSKERVSYTRKIYLLVWVILVLVTIILCYIGFNYLTLMK